MNSPVHLSEVMCLSSAKASSGFFDPFETPSPWLFGVDQPPGICATPSVSGVHPVALSFEEEVGRRMGVQHADRARGEGAVRLDPAAGPGDLVDGAALRCPSRGCPGPRAPSAC